MVSLELSVAVALELVDVVALELVVVVWLLNMEVKITFTLKIILLVADVATKFKY